MKYIIEIEDEPINGLYKAKNFKTLVFDEYGLKQMEKVEEAVKDALDELRIGDEIVVDGSPEYWCGVVTYMNEYGFQIMSSDGDTEMFGKYVKYHKTGRHFSQVADLLRSMQADWHPREDDVKLGYEGCNHCTYMDKAEHEYPCVDCTHGGMTGGRSYYKDRSKA